MTLSTSAVAVCCCKRFAQFAEQPRVLDGDDGLRGEVRDQLNLLVGERTNFLAVDGDDADQIIFLEHRNGKHSAHAGEFSDRRLQGSRLP